MKNDLMLKDDKKLVELIKKEAIECVETLTTHGLPNLSRTKYTFIKFIWLLLTISSAGVSIYLIIKTLAEYLEYNVTTEVRLINAEESLEFPTISICNKNRFSTNYSVEMIRELIKTKYNHSFEDFFHPNFSNSFLSISEKIFLQENETKYFFSNIEMNEREKYGLSIKDSLKYCRFMNQDCKFSDFEWFFNSKYGNCYRFNPIKPNKRTKENNEDGLTIEILLKNPKELDILDFEKGLYVSIDSNNLDTYFDFENLIEVSTGFQTNIKIQKSFFQKYPKPYSNCDFRDGLVDSITLEQKELYNEIIKANFSYSQSFCLVYCRHRLYYHQFSCKFRANSLTVPNVKYCKPSEDLKLLERESNYHQSATDSCLQTCPIECETIKYDTDIFITKYPNIYLKYFQHFGDIKDKEEITSQDLLKLKIFFGSLNFMSYNESPSMSVFGLVSNLGGILGLFLGKNCLLVVLTE